MTTSSTKRKGLSKRGDTHLPGLPGLGFIDTEQASELRHAVIDVKGNKKKPIIELEATFSSTEAESV